MHGYYTRTLRWPLVATCACEVYEAACGIRIKIFDYRNITHEAVDKVSPDQNSRLVDEMFSRPERRPKVPGRGVKIKLSAWMSQRAFPNFSKHSLDNISLSGLTYFVKCSIFHAAHGQINIEIRMRSEFKSSLSRILKPLARYDCMENSCIIEA